MAYLELRNGTKKHISREQGEKLWNGLQDPESIDETQQKFLGTIKAIYLNWRHAPDSYIKENLDDIIPMALNEWSVDKRGHITRPSTPFAWQFAKRWGLWEFGRPTSLVGGHALIAEALLAPLIPVDHSKATNAD